MVNSMKIVALTINIRRVTKDLDISPDDIVENIELRRNEDKLWFVESDYTSRRGLFLNEITLATMLQEVIAKYNSTKD